jgi:hypothetical protein
VRVARFGNPAFPQRVDEAAAQVDEVLAVLQFRQRRRMLNGSPRMITLGFVLGFNELNGGFT